MRGLPFMYEGAPAYRISIMDEKTVIRTAMDGLHRLGYNVAELEQFLDDAPEQEAFGATCVCYPSQEWCGSQFPIRQADGGDNQERTQAQVEQRQQVLDGSPVSIVHAIEKLESCGLPNSKELVSAIIRYLRLNYIQGHAERVALSGAADMTDEQRQQEIDSRLAGGIPTRSSVVPIPESGCALC